MKKLKAYKCYLAYKYPTEEAVEGWHLQKKPKERSVEINYAYSLEEIWARCKEASKHGGFYPYKIELMEGEEPTGVLPTFEARNGYIAPVGRGANLLIKRHA